MKQKLGQFGHRRTGCVGIDNTGKDSLTANGLHFDHGKRVRDEHHGIAVRGRARRELDVDYSCAASIVD
jgi:hypothetical protein